MKITVNLHIDAQGRDVDGSSYDAAPSYAGAPHLEVDGASCARCGSTPLRVAGFKGAASTVTTADATYTACGCVACNAHVGTIKREASSIFGEEEDARVLSGGWRVY